MLTYLATQIALMAICAVGTVSLARWLYRDALRHYYGRIALQTILLSHERWRAFAKTIDKVDPRETNPEYGSVGWICEYARLIADQMVARMASPQGMFDRIAGVDAKATCLPPVDERETPR